MSNMSYCRFTNTLGDLQDCFDHIDDEDLSEMEKQSRDEIIKLCKEIADEFEDEDQYYK